MGIGKATRALGKIGLAIEMATYAVRGIGALVNVIRGRASSVDPVPEVEGAAVDSESGRPEQSAAD